MIWSVVTAMVYAAISGAVIYWLLVAAWKYCRRMEPLVYVLCGILWPVAALPALGIILANKRIQQIKEGMGHGKG